jgi:hypothetical protein
MSNPIDRTTTQMTELGVAKFVQQVGKQLEGLQDAISLHPSETEVSDALGAQASTAEQNAYRLGHQSGWYKGALMFGCAVLAGLAVVTFAVSGESKKG